MHDLSDGSDKVESLFCVFTTAANRWTLHGFRGGAAVSTALAGVDLHAIMDHVGWKRREEKRPCTTSS